jgi:hypothetical protein
MATAGAMAAKTGRVAAGTVANLAQGTWDVGMNKASKIKKAAKERIGETAGAKIAAAIKAREVAGKTTGQAATFDGNTLSAGSKDVDAEAEIAAFRDRKA